jgi:4-hydroxymandelate oxidase
MDFTELRSQAAARLATLPWEYYEGTADPADAGADERAWLEISTVPRVLRGLRSVDTTVVVGGLTLPTPVTVAATAAHGMAHPDGERATAAGAAAAGALMVYSSSASVEVTSFAAACSGPWWAQTYIMKDLAATRDYLTRCREAGADAIVLTVDQAGALADTAFRAASRHVPTVPANWPGWSWAEMTANLDPTLTPDHIGWVADVTGRPVHVKGILHPDDAVRAIDAGAAGIVVSNHGRRQLAGVLPTAAALASVVDAVAGRVPVSVDGGIRSGVDVLRALALGATAVGIGRPILWGLAVDGPDGVAAVIATLTAELRQALAAAGAASPADLDRSFVRGPRRATPWDR